MSWTTPKTWLAGSPLLAAELNTHLRDNLAALKAPPTNGYGLNRPSDYSTSSTAFVDVDSTYLALAITTSGGDIMVGFACSVVVNACAVALDLTIDGVRVAGDEGIIEVGNLRSDEARSLSFVYLLSTVPAGAHTIKLQWRVDTGSATMYAGAGSAGVTYGGLADIHPQFWVREVS